MNPTTPSRRPKQRQRLGSKAGRKGRIPPLCSFCQAKPTAIVASGRISSAVDKPFCMLHYYATRAVRAHPPIFATDNTGNDAKNQKKTKKKKNQAEEEAPQNLRLVETELKKQLPKVQALFEEAFTSLQREIADVAAASYQQRANYNNHKNNQNKKHGSFQSSDPLAILGGLGSSTTTTTSSKRRSSTKSPTQNNFDTEANDGGFVRDIQLPERYVQQQKQTMQKSQEMMHSVSKGAAKSSSKRPPANFKSQLTVQANPYKRRKKINMTYWDPSGSSASSSKKRKHPSSTSSANPTTMQDSSTEALSVTCTCGSTQVQTMGNMTSRNQDMAKGETWGNKNRVDSLVVRCCCAKCGKMWNEEI